MITTDFSIHETATMRSLPHETTTLPRLVRYYADEYVRVYHFGDSEPYESTSRHEQRKKAALKRKNKKEKPHPKWVQNRIDKKITR